jgi:sec-independent protein translocase protein TatA
VENDMPQLALWSPGPLEVVIILVVVLLLFGKRLPSVGRSLGRGIVEFKKGLKGIKDDVEEAGSKDEEPKTRP